jgi:uncharacterized protein
MSEPHDHLLLVGVSTRALAQSAARRGLRVTAVDAFGDADLRAVAEVVTLDRTTARRGAEAAAATARQVPASLVAYTSNLENYPAAVAVLAHNRRLLGNPPETLEQVRNPLLLARALAASGFEVPATRAGAPASPGHTGRWLLKPRRSGGGHGTSVWRSGRPVARSQYLQQRIGGLPGSIVFAADGRRAMSLGLTRQLVGLAEVGADGFRYCGSLLASAGRPVFPRQPELLARARALADAVTERFGLTGLNGVDFIARDGVPVPIEVNPRYSASMELIERATGLSLFEVHREACEGRLPAAVPPPAEVWGKAIVFARRPVTVDDPRAWQVELADVPHPGERIDRGRPICTVFGRAGTEVGCRRALIRAARAVYAATGSRAAGAA